MKLKRNNIIILFICYKIILDFCYPLINETFLYNFNNPLHFNIFKYIEGNILFIFMLYIINKINNNLVKELLYILFSLNYVPLITIYFYLNESRLFLYLITGCYLLTILSYNIFLKITIKKIKKIRISDNKIRNFNLIIFIFFLINCYYNFGIFNLIDSFHFKKLYIIRESNKFSQLLSYILIYLIYFTIPFLLYLFKKSYFKVMMIVALTVVIYSYNPKKIILAYLLVYLGIIYMKKINILTILLNSYIIFLLIGKITKKIFFIGMSDRTFYLPAVLTYKYYDFFKKNTYNLFNNSKLGIFFPKISDYGMEYTYYISKYYYNSPMNANANYLASSYAEGGILVMIIISIVLGGIFSVIGKSSPNIDEKLILMLTLSNILMLTNGPLWLIFFSNGFLLTLMYLINSKKNKENMC